MALSIRPTLWIAALAVVVLAAGLAIGFRQAFVYRPRPQPPLATTPADTSETVIDEALDLIPVDSTAFKSRWIDDVAELDLTVLSLEQHEIFLRFANAESCTCGCGYTLATCRINDPECPFSLPRLEALLDSVRTGKIRSADGLRERPPASARRRSRVRRRALAVARSRVRPRRCWAKPRRAAASRWLTVRANGG
jgi:hypothetical protein